jgi:hypothetical protein
MDFLSCSSLFWSTLWTAGANWLHLYRLCSALWTLWTPDPTKKNYKKDGEDEDKDGDDNYDDDAEWHSDCPNCERPGPIGIICSDCDFRYVVYLATGSNGKGDKEKVDNECDINDEDEEDDEQIAKDFFDEWSR